MPFDEEEDDDSINQKIGLKKVSSQKSIFELGAKKTNQQDLVNKVNKIQENSNSYKSRAALLASEFNKTMSDKTLKQNKNLFSREMERELLTNMIQLAVDINNDPYEQEGMGTLSWITLLLKTCLSQRDRINQLEFSISNLENKLNSDTVDKSK